MIKVSKSSVCRNCTDQPASMDRISMDIGDGASLELVDKISSLGDMLSVDGDANAVVEARVRKWRNKFRQLLPLLTKKDASFLMRGKLYTSCMRTA